MEVPFSKYQGAGNDFIIIDMTSSQLPITPQQLQRMCERKTGIGANGVLVLQKSLLPGCRYKLLHCNPSDGLEGWLCGNGSRCSVAFAERVGLITFEGHNSPILFEAADGVHTGGKVSEENYFISIKDIALSDVSKIDNNNYYLNIGTPHHVRFVDEVSNMDVERIGKELRWAMSTNANFVQIVNDEDIRVRTYEEGVEEETLACGTGATASAVLSFLRRHRYFDDTEERCADDDHVRVKIRVSMAGGDLEVGFTAGPQVVSDIRLSGPVKHVFDGVCYL